MGRYTGPVFRKARRLGFSILETNKEFTKGKKRTSVPGQHGVKLKRRRTTNAYTNQLFEKQKIKNVYGLREQQLKNLFKKCNKKSGVIGTNLLIALESRLDNILYRLNIASTRRQARQFVNHGLVLVNGKKSSIPSMIVKINDIISIKPKLQTNKLVLENISLKKKTLPFLELNKDKVSGKYLRYPVRDELNSDIKEIEVVEFFSK